MWCPWDRKRGPSMERAQREGECVCARASHSVCVCVCVCVCNRKRWEEEGRGYREEITVKKGKRRGFRSKTRSSV